LRPVHEAIIRDGPGKVKPAEARIAAADFPIFDAIKEAR